MSRRRIGLYGANDEALRLARLLADAPDADVARVYDPDPRAAVARAKSLGSDLALLLRDRVGDDFAAFTSDYALDVVVDDGQLEPFIARFPEATARGMQVVSPLTARLLFGYSTSPRDRKAELLQALAEIVESVELTIDSQELFTRMLEIAVGVTHAEGGSLMLLDPTRRELYIEVAIGVEPELWPKIRVPLGEGIAGQVAATATSIHVEGRADRRHFHILRERLDVESAISAPLIDGGQVLGVLNLHHTLRSDAFSAEDLAFVEQLASLDAQIIRRAQDHARMRDHAARYEAVRETHDLLASPAPLATRLQSICKRVAERMGDGIASIYLCETAPESTELMLTATSLSGGGFGGEYRIVIGQGVDGGVAKSRRPTFLRGEQGRIAYAALPLMIGEHLVGVLAAQAGIRPPHGRAAEEALLEIAAAVAEGVGRARREADIRARATRMSAINETGVRMLSATDVDEVARLATSSLAMILDADHAILRLRDPKTRRYRVSSYFGSADDSVQPGLFELDKLVSIETIKRRTLVFVRDLARDSKLAPFANDFTSLISAPLKVDGAVIGTVSIYDKVAIDRFFVGQFDDEDSHVFGRFVAYVERSIANASAHEAARAHSNFDSETELPNAGYLVRRIREESVRAGQRPQAFAIATCEIANAGALTGPERPHQLHDARLAIRDALRAELRDFDVPGRLDDGGFAVLLPDPGPEPAERIASLARAISDRIRRDEALNQPVQVELSFGYAIQGEDGSSDTELLARARQPRIQMV